MEPIGPLMHEHRLIERMLAVARTMARSIEAGNPPDFVAIAQVVDFIRTYADRCHHGKEEDILFAGLEGKALSAGHRAIMDELVEEHRQGRRMVAALERANRDAVAGRPDAIRDIAATLRALVEFYPPHIEKEDKRFFFPALDYLTREEREDMLARYDTFERRLLHETYEDMVAGFERGVE
jgi:hemerythrin-like domain-containing protein